MLPHIDAEERGVADDDSLLVGEGHDAQLARDGLLDEPAPAAALDAEQRRREGLLELVDAAPGGRDGGLQLGGRAVDLRVGRRGGCEAFPEQGVVDVPAAVEPDRGELGLRVLQVALREGGRGRGESLVQVRYVRLVVLGVV